MNTTQNIVSLKELYSLADSLQIAVSNWFKYEDELLRITNKFDDQWYLKCLDCKYLVVVKRGNRNTESARKKIKITKEDLVKSKETPIMGKYHCPKCKSQSTVLFYVPKDKEVEEMIALYKSLAKRYKRMAFNIVKKLPFYEFWLKYVYGAGETTAIVLGYLVLKSFAKHGTFITQAVWRYAGLVPYAYCPKCKTVVYRRYEKGRIHETCGTELIPILPTKRLGIKLDFNPKLRARILVSAESMLKKQQECFKKNSDCGVYYAALLSQYNDLLRKGEKKLPYLYPEYNKLSAERKNKILHMWALKALRVILAKILIEHASRIMAMHYGLPYSMPINRSGHEVYDPLVDIKLYDGSENNKYVNLEQSRYYLSTRR